MIAPTIVLPRHEYEGRRAFSVGSAFQNECITNGFAFCPYASGSLERNNWLAGYASMAFDPELLEAEQKLNMPSEASS